ncbi:unnamed protein product [Mesocestoides corti]|uniref:Uncharacterized protein n=1 Tax=Mesocestoides corti TaxID=53468 RepID=A0A0R3URK9_MESCO|nr:unnamed protein product [Mesocestoides corti]
MEQQLVVLSTVELRLRHTKPARPYAVGSRWIYGNVHAVVRCTPWQSHLESWLMLGGSGDVYGGSVESGVSKSSED